MCVVAPLDSPTGISVCCIYIGIRSTVLKGRRQSKCMSSMQRLPEAMAGLTFLVLLACLAAWGSAQSTDIKVVIRTVTLVLRVGICLPYTKVLTRLPQPWDIILMPQVSVNVHLTPSMLTFFMAQSMLGPCVRLAPTLAAGARPGGVGAVLHSACGRKPDERRGRHGAGRRPASPAQHPRSQPAPNAQRQCVHYHWPGHAGGPEFEQLPKSCAPAHAAPDKGPGDRVCVRAICHPPTCLPSPSSLGSQCMQCANLLGMYQ